MLIKIKAFYHLYFWIILLLASITIIHLASGGNRIIVISVIFTQMFAIVSHNYVKRAKYLKYTLVFSICFVTILTTAKLDSLISLIVFGLLLGASLWMLKIHIPKRMHTDFIYRELKFYKKADKIVLSKSFIKMESKTDDPFLYDDKHLFPINQSELEYLKYILILRFHGNPKVTMMSDDQGIIVIEKQ
ncbi:MAG: hypothetical protein WCI62_00595 [Erysipelotrichaceae bacterium]